MPDLPTRNVTPAQADRLLAVFSGQTDDDTGAPLTPQQAYLRWLTKSLREYVITMELRDLDESHNATKRAHVDDARGALP